MDSSVLRLSKNAHIIRIVPEIKKQKRRFRLIGFCPAWWLGVKFFRIIFKDRKNPQHSVTDLQVRKNPGEIENYIFFVKNAENVRLQIF